jgi:hypothetical protein
MTWLSLFCTVDPYFENYTAYPAKTGETVIQKLSFAGNVLDWDGCNASGR